MSRHDWTRTYCATVLLPLIVTGVRLCCCRHAQSTAGLLDLVLTDLTIVMYTITVGYVLAQVLAWDAVP